MENTQLWLSISLETVSNQLEWMSISLEAMS